MDKMNKIGQTALIYACIEKHVDMAKLLLKVTLDNKSEENNLRFLSLGFFRIHLSIRPHIRLRSLNH